MSKVTITMITTMIVVLAVTAGCGSSPESQATATARTAGRTATAEARAAESTAEAAADHATATARVAARESTSAARDAERANAAATRAAMPTATLIPCQGAIKCDDFPFGASPQAYWERCGRPAQMDGDGDGIVCEGD